MSKKHSKVYLGFEDEPILDENCGDVNYSTNKIGGIAKSSPLEVVFMSKCKVCGVQRPLVLQCYAPLPSSPYHRTLYIFACINPLCWNNSNSWSCFRSQHLDDQFKKNTIATENLKECQAQATPSDHWCSGADEWGENDDVSGNVFSFASSNVQNVPTAIERMSDSEDESVEMSDLYTNIENMSLNNVNNEGPSAEIERGEFSDVIVDEINVPENNLINLLSQVPDLPEELKTGGNVQFTAKYIAVEEEYLSESGKTDHVDKLLEQYQAENKEDFQKLGNKQKSKGKKPGETEEYEKVAPKHGNELFHNFLTRIQLNPMQIIRYSHDGQPLPMLPLPSSLRLLKCEYCKGEMCFELQILPTIIPSLKIPQSTSTHLEFGTVLVYTCKLSCWAVDDVVKSEIIIVQKEPA